MKKKLKWYLLAAIILLIVIASQTFILVNYYYNPITFPKGNVSEVTQLSYTDFKKPLVIEAVTWDEDGNQHFYQFVSDEKKIKKIIKYFDKASRLDQYNMNRYIESIPKTDENEKYIIHVKQLVTSEGVEFGGRTLFSFDFYKNNSIFKVSNANFFEFEDELKEEIFSALSDESKWVTF